MNSVIFSQLFPAPHPLLLELQLHTLLDHLILSQSSLRLCYLESLSVDQTPLTWEDSKLKLSPLQWVKAEISTLSAAAFQQAS